MGTYFLGLALLVCFTQFRQVICGIESTEILPLITDGRLPKEVAPSSYAIDFTVDMEKNEFRGSSKINITFHESTDMIKLNGGFNLNIYSVGARLLPREDEKEKIPPVQKILNITRIIYQSSKGNMEIQLEKPMREGIQVELDFKFGLSLFDMGVCDGMCLIEYVDTDDGVEKQLVATKFRPNSARKAFPCFDEPMYKTPFKISIARQKGYKSLSNMPLLKTIEKPDEPGWEIDIFEESPPMSTFSVGIHVSRFIENQVRPDKELMEELGLEVDIIVTGRPSFNKQFKETANRIAKVLKALQDYWGVPYPLPKLHCVGLPRLPISSPSDTWGLIFFRESDLTTKSNWLIAQELVYQWLGHDATYFWWSDAHINTALAKYLSAVIVLKLNEEDELFNNWPTTMIYSMYYELSKRHPKSSLYIQDSAVIKTTLLFRMFNLTMGETFLKAAMQKFINDKKSKSYFSDEIWSAMTAEARFHNILNESISINEMVGSWIPKDRIPIVTVTRNHSDGSANISHWIFLRERPHDVQDQDKYSWWIPIVYVKENNLNFSNTTPAVWMNEFQREIRIENFAKAGEIAIVNPEEIAPFVVNYDDESWNMLATFLQNNTNRMRLPGNTRAKLVHDALNIALAGKLSFDVALNMTLFLINEREIYAWDPMFAMVGHIIRQIDNNRVHKKFQAYLRYILAPMCEEIGPEGEEKMGHYMYHLRNACKTFLCNAGYKPCVKKAQEMYDIWMESENPNEGNPVQNPYLCPVFKWGTKKEWEFGLERVLQFPQNRQQNERTYLIKTLASCPQDEWKVEKLLNITIIEPHAAFNDNDINMILGMFTTSTNGFNALFQFLDKRFDDIIKRHKPRTSTFHTILTSATNYFKTQEGLDKVEKFLERRRGKLEDSEMVVERAIKMIKSEIPWTTEILPVMERWLDAFFKRQNIPVDENGIPKYPY